MVSKPARGFLLITLLVLAVSIDAFAGIQFRAPRPRFRAGTHRIDDYHRYYEEYTVQRDFFLKTDPARYELMKELKGFDEKVEAVNARIKKAQEERNLTDLTRALDDAERLAGQRHEVLERDFLKRGENLGATVVKRDNGEYEVTLIKPVGAEIGGVNAPGVVRAAPGDADHGGTGQPSASGRPTGSPSEALNASVAPAVSRVLDDMKFTTLFDKLDKLDAKTARELRAELRVVIGGYLKERVNQGLPALGPNDKFIEGFVAYFKDNVKTPEDAAAALNFLKSITKRDPRASGDLKAELDRTEGYFKSSGERRKAIIAGAGRLTGMRLKLLDAFTARDAQGQIIRNPDGTPKIDHEKVSKKLGEWVYAGEDFRKALETEPGGQKLFAEWIKDGLTGENAKWKDEINKRQDEGLCETLRNCHGSMNLKCAA